MDNSKVTILYECKNSGAKVTSIKVLVIKVCTDLTLPRPKYMKNASLWLDFQNLSLVSSRPWSSFTGSCLRPARPRRKDTCESSMQRNVWLVKAE